MYFGARAVMAAVFGLMGPGSEGSAPKLAWSLTVCLPSAPADARRAQPITSRMFADIGVAISWHDDEEPCPPDGVIVTLAADIPRAVRPGALADSRLFDGSEVRVFYNRVLEMVPPDWVPCLLAHVLAHELAHIAQAIDRHSSHGLMKASWELADLRQMVRGRLLFSSHDVDLIRRGLGARARKAEGRTPLWRVRPSAFYLVPFPFVNVFA